MVAYGYDFDAQSHVFSAVEILTGIGVLTHEELRRPGAFCWNGYPSPVVA